MQEKKDHLLVREGFKDQSTLELGLEVCTDVLQATCYDRVAGMKMSWAREVGAYTSGLASQSEVSIKELCQVVILES